MALDQELDEMLEKLQNMDELFGDDTSHIVIHGDSPKRGGGGIHIHNSAQDIPAEDIPLEDISVSDAMEEDDSEDIWGEPVSRPGDRSRRERTWKERLGRHKGAGRSRREHFTGIHPVMNPETILTIVLSAVTIAAVIFIIVNFEALSTILLAVFLFLFVNLLKFIIIAGLSAVVGLGIRSRVRRYGRWGRW